MATAATEQPIPGVTLDWRQIGGLAGILGVVLFAIGVLLLGDIPTTNDSVAETRSWYEDNGQRFLVGDYLMGLAIVIFFLPFFVVLREVLGEAEGGAQLWSRLAFLSGVFFVIYAAAGAVASGVLAMNIEAIENDGTVRALQLADFYAYGGISLTFVPLAVAASLIALRTGFVWTWAGWLGLLIAVLGVIGAAARIDGDPDGVLAIIEIISVIGFGVFVLVLSAAMLRSRGAD